MKRIWFVILSLIILMEACSPAATVSPKDQLQVTVSVLPQAWFVEKLGGEHVSVQAMVGTGDDPHTYEPTPEQMRVLGRSKIYFSIGVEFEAAWLSRFTSSNPKMKVIDSAAGIQRFIEGTSLAAALGSAAAETPAPGGEPDPHIWFSVIRMKQMARNMASAMGEMEPSRKDIYSANLDILLNELDQLDKQIRSSLKGISRDHFMVIHPGWTYFAEEYGLTEMSIEVGGQEPGPEQLGVLLDAAKKYDITVLFIQRNVNSKLAQSVANQLGITQVIEWDPLPKDWSDYMLKIARDLAMALK